MALLTPARAAVLAARFLDNAEPSLIRALRASWRDMANATPEAALTEMFRTGNPPASIADKWATLYSEFVLDKVAPRLLASAEQAASTARVATTLPREALADAIRARADLLLTSAQETQRRAVQTILEHHISVEPFSRKQLAAVIKPALGVTERDAQRILNMRASLIADGVSPDRVESILTRTLASAQRARADTIARTELAAAYNYGTQSAIENAVREGAFDGPVFKEWSTQKDEMTCQICAPLNKTRVGLNEEFPVGSLPPAHPRCRCVILYRTE